MLASRARVAAAATTLLFLSACKEKTEPLVPANITALSATTFNSVAGAAVAAASLPSVKVTTADGTVVPDVDVIFTLIGGGSGGGTVATNSEGVATATSWTLGTTVGPYVMQAEVVGISTGAVFTATAIAGPASKVVLTTTPTATVANRAVFGTQPVAQIQDANSNPVLTAGVTVTVSISSGGGTLGGTATAQTNASGTATFTNLSIAGTAGARTLSFAATGLTPASANVTTTAGAATTISKQDGDNQAAFPNTAVAIAPAVKVADQDGNGVSGVPVTFAVTGGGGSVNGGGAVSGSNGVAAVTSWTLGAAEGSNTLSASATGLTGSPLTFTATATITGTGFSATPANNTVTIDGLAATVTVASPTSLTVTVPTLACTPGHNATVAVTVNGVTGSRSHPVQAGTAHSLAVGQSVVLSTSAAAKCNELHNANASAQYYVSVYNTNSTYSVTGASFELKGTAGAAASVVSSPALDLRQRAARPVARRARRPGENDDSAHIALLEKDVAFLRQNASKWAGKNRAAMLQLGGTQAHAVGDNVTVRLRDLDAAGCNTYVTVSGRVAYVGTKNIIVEDLANAVLNIDTTYAQIGAEFDNTMYPILETNYGNPLVNDAALDNNGKFIMVFTNKIRNMAGGSVAGFVSACDLFPQATFSSSNVGEYFYAIAPQQAGTINTSTANGQSPPLWRWAIRGTIIHEVKHIVSTGERFSRNGGSVFEESWLEESLARLSEELFERARYTFTQRSNIGYGSAGNPVGPYCGVRACNGQARGIVRVFEELASKWYSAPQLYSPIGRIDQNDFSFYATAWSLLRWTIDANQAKAESAILKGMTQEPTLTGIANFNNQMGMTFVDALPKWTLAMVVDDYPAFTPADATLKQPSWNFRDVYQGYYNDFSSQLSLQPWPFTPTPNLFGNFSATASVRPGTAAVLQISGSQSAKQLLELKANGSSAAAPAELRMAIVRVQ